MICFNYFASNTYRSNTLDITYVNANPTHNRAKPAYGLVQLINIRPITVVIGTKFEIPLLIFLIVLLFSMPFTNKRSATAPDIIVNNQNSKYGMAASPPLYKMKNKN